MYDICVMVIVYCMVQFCKRVGILFMGNGGVGNGLNFCYKNAFRVVVFSLVSFFFTSPM